MNVKQDCELWEPITYIKPYEGQDSTLIYFLKLLHIQQYLELNYYRCTRIITGSAMALGTTTSYGLDRILVNGNEKLIKAFAAIGGIIFSEPFSTAICSTILPLDEQRTVYRCTSHNKLETEGYSLLDKKKQETPSDTPPNIELHNSPTVTLSFKVTTEVTNIGNARVSDISIKDSREATPTEVIEELKVIGENIGNHVDL